MTKEEHAKVLAALEESYGLVEHAYATDWRHDFPTGKDHLEGMREGVKRHKEAIAIMLKEPEPISDAEILELWSRTTCEDFTDSIIAFGRALLEKAR